MSNFTQQRILLDRLLRDLDEVVDEGLLGRDQVQMARDAVQSARLRTLEELQAEREDRRRHQED